MTAEFAAPPAIFVLDPRSFDVAVDGKPPVVPYSHDLTLYVMAHEALRIGLPVGLARGIDAARRGAVMRVAQVYPELSWRPGQFDPQRTGLVVCAGLEQLAVRGQFGAAKLVAMVPALHMIEQPLLHGPRHVASWVEVLRHHVDFIVTQNERMRDIVATLSHWLARWEPGEHILVAPLGFADVGAGPPSQARRDTARRELALAAGHTLILNGGGSWSWTDCDSFVAALIAHHQARRSRVRAFFPALRQGDNTAPNPVADRIERLRRDHPALFGASLADSPPICIAPDWETGSRLMLQMLLAADLGLSVSKPGFEGWQSHRVRFAEYLSHGLPVMATPESSLAELASDAVISVVAGDAASYRAALTQLETKPAVLAERRARVIAARDTLASSQTYLPALLDILRRPARDFSHRLDADFISLWQDRARAEVGQRATRAVHRALGL